MGKVVSLMELLKEHMVVAIRSQAFEQKEVKPEKKKRVTATSPRLFDGI